MRTFRLLVAVAIFGVLLLSNYTEAQSVIIKPDTLTIDVVGGLEPYKSTEVSTSEMGVIAEVLVKRGEHVTKDQPISRLDDRQQKVLVKEAEADFLAAGQLETIKYEKLFNERRVEITKALVEQGKGSRRELERYELEYDIAKAKLISGEEAKVIAGIRAEKARLLLESRTVVAPHDGIIDEIYRSEGEFVASNAPAIVRLVDARRLRATFMLPEVISEQFRGKDAVEVRLPNGSVVPGVVEFIATVASIEGRTLAMTVLIDNEDEKIRSAHCELVLP